jgi:hypothetical protein
MTIYDSIFLGTIALYCAVGVWTCAVKRWPLRGGLTTAVIAYLPVFYQLSIGDDSADPPGHGFILIPLLGTSFLMFSTGLVYNALRIYRKRQTTKSSFKP